MTSKPSRSALIAALTVGACGFVAVPAQAANGISTANYYVNNPVVTGVTGLTPESAVLHGGVDTGGNPLSYLTVGVGNILNWENAVTLAGSSTPYDIDGLPATGSDDSVSVTITDSACTGTGSTPYAAAPCDGLVSGKAGFISNAGADDYSSVGFEYDPVSDYDANGDEPGADTEYATEVNVPTAAGLSAVGVSVGAFGVKAQDNTGQTPLTPGTKYYYWIVQQPGVTDQAEDVNIAQWAQQTANPTYKCYPDAAIAADPTLAGYGSSTQINYDGTTAPAIQGACKYDYGNTSGAIYYTSPNGEFTTPALGKIAISNTATVGGKRAFLGVTDKSAFKASGTLQLKIGHKLVASGKFSLSDHATADVTLKLTGAGVKAAARNRKAKVVLTSNFQQPSSTKSVTL